MSKPRASGKAVKFTARLVRANLATATLWNTGRESPAIALIRFLNRRYAANTANTDPVKFT